ncbi:MAG: CbiQ family ECF transporter T component, partial [Candidatus Freyarchaeota archaeon]
MILAGYVRKDVFLHRTDPRAKLVLVFCILLLSFAVYDFAYLLLLLLLVSALLLLGRVEGGSLRRTLKFVAPLLIFLLAVQSVCYEYAYLVVY